MKYMMLLVSEAGSWESIPEAKQKEIFGRIGEWWGELSGKGKIVDGYQLQPVHTATTVKLNGGKPVVTDGPFAEAKEALVGYWIVDVESEDRAIEIASKIVAFVKAPIEVRRVMDAPPDF